METTLPLAPDALDQLTDAWCLWPQWQEYPPALIRRLDEQRYVACIPFIYTWGVVWGYLDSPLMYADRWCYHDMAHALAAATAWDPSTSAEPEGWHRHTTTGRRRPDADAAREYVAH